MLSRQGLPWDQRGQRGPCWNGGSDPDVVLGLEPSLRAGVRRRLLPPFDCNLPTLIHLSTHSEASQVSSWLEQEGFGEDWQVAFAENEIDGEALKLLKDPVSLPSASAETDGLDVST